MNTNNNIIQDLFNTFLGRIELTQQQKQDAKTKYQGVCKTLHNYYYSSQYTGSTKFLFGSYKTQTNIRPLTDKQDVDVIFIMPPEKFERYDNYISNGQSSLLQEMRQVLNKTYSTTDKIKGWEKVVLVNFAQNKHNVEVLPAWERKDGSFCIPTTTYGGQWEVFNPREHLNLFKQSNQKTQGLTRSLCKLFKAWNRNTKTLTLKSFEIEKYVIDFINHSDLSYQPIQYIIKNLFAYIEENCNYEHYSHLLTAISRAKKAIELEEKEKFYPASLEWQKVFSKQFPKCNKSIKLKTIHEDYSPQEEYIENLFIQNLEEVYHLEITCKVQQAGYRPECLKSLLKHSRLKVKKKLEFHVTHNISAPYQVYWKVRNFGEEARKRDDLRGKIVKDQGHETKEENTKYKGSHYVECYIIKNNYCVARDRIDIPISN